MIVESIRYVFPPIKSERKEPLSVSLATHRRPNLDLFTTSNILHRIVQDQVEEHVIPPQRTRYESVRIEVEVDGFVHVLEVRSSVKVSKGAAGGMCGVGELAHLFQFGLLSSRHGGRFRFEWVGMGGWF